MKFRWRIILWCNKIWWWKYRLNVRAIGFSNSTFFHNKVLQTLKMECLLITLQWSKRVISRCSTGKCFRFEQYINTANCTANTDDKTVIQSKFLIVIVMLLQSYLISFFRKVNRWRYRWRCLWCNSELLCPFSTPKDSFLGFFKPSRVIIA